MKTFFFLLFIISSSASADETIVSDISILKIGDFINNPNSEPIYVQPLGFTFTEGMNIEITSFTEPVEMKSKVPIYTFPINCTVEPVDIFQVSDFFYNEKTDSFQIILVKMNGVLMQESVVLDGICPRGSIIPIDGECETKKTIWQNVSDDLHTYPSQATPCRPLSLNLFALGFEEVFSENHQNGEKTNWLSQTIEFLKTSIVWCWKKQDI